MSGGGHGVQRGIQSCSDGSLPTVVRSGVWHATPGLTGYDMPGHGYADLASRAQSGDHGAGDAADASDAVIAQHSAHTPSFTGFTGMWNADEVDRAPEQAAGQPHGLHHHENELGQHRYHAPSYPLSGGSAASEERINDMSSTIRPGDSVSQHIFNAPNFADRTRCRTPSSLGQRTQPQPSAHLSTTSVTRPQSKAETLNRFDERSLTSDRETTKHRGVNESSLTRSTRSDRSTRSTRSAHTPSSDPSFKTSNPTHSEDYPIVPYAGTTLETDDLLTTNPEEWRVNARANDFSSLFLLAMAAARRNAELLAKLQRSERRFHFYNSGVPQSDFDGRTYSEEERRKGREKHFGYVKLVALTQSGGSTLLPLEIKKTVKRFESLNKPGPYRR